MSFSPVIAASSAETDFSRPTNSGTTMPGKTTISRKGSRGSKFKVISTHHGYPEQHAGKRASRRVPAVPARYGVSPAAVQSRIAARLWMGGRGKRPVLAGQPGGGG